MAPPKSRTIVTAVSIVILCMMAMSVAAEPASPDASVPDAHIRDASVPDASLPDAETPSSVKQRRREGDVFDGQGTFQSTGDRVTFYSEVDNEADKEVFRVLENLALERITRILEDPSGLGASRKWSVTGVVTEYRGSNYLLIERAILKAR